MLSSKWTSCLLIGVFAVAMSSCATQESKPKPAKPAVQPPAPVKEPNEEAPRNRDEKTTYNLHPEADNTDSYAVPSDSTEEELNEEMEDLNKLSK